VFGKMVQGSIWTYSLGRYIMRNITVHIEHSGSTVTTAKLGSYDEVDMQLTGKTQNIFGILVRETSWKTATRRKRECRMVR
jgi:hypothetical protein